MCTIFDISTTPVELDFKQYFARNDHRDITFTWQIVSCERFFLYNRSFLVWFPEYNH